MCEPVLRRPDEREPIDNPVGGRIAFMVRGADTGGRMTALETVVPPGEGPPLHTHAAEDEVLYVLEGDVRFQLGDRVDAAPAGSFVFIPRGVSHTWQNTGDHDARMLVLFTPAGMERFFEGFAALREPSPDAFATIGAGAGMAVVGPPLRG